MKQDGYISMIGLLACLLISSFFILQILQKYQRNQEVTVKVQVLLCAKEHSSLLRKYLKNMARLNQSILTSYLLKHTPVPAISKPAKIAHKASKLIQYGVHISFLKNQIETKHCNWTQKALWAKSQPYSQGPWLKRTVTGVAKLKEKKWFIIYPPQLKKLRPSRYFYLQSDFQLSSPLSNDIELKAKEVSSPLSLLSG